MKEKEFHRTVNMIYWMNDYMSTYKLKSLDELLKALDYHTDIEFFLYGIRYNISWRDEKPFICVCPDGDAIFFDTAEELLTQYMITENKALIEVWKDIDVYVL